MSHLDYETCCKLRDAGFEQNTVQWITHAWRKLTNSSYATATSAVACPNTDEMLAHLQATYPHYMWRLCQYERGWAAFPISTMKDAFHDIPLTETPALALAALICKLHQEQQHNGRD